MLLRVTLQPATKRFLLMNVSLNVLDALQLFLLGGAQDIEGCRKFACGEGSLLGRGLRLFAQHLQFGKPRFFFARSSFRIRLQLAFRVFVSFSLRVRSGLTARGLACCAATLQSGSGALQFPCSVADPFTSDDVGA